MNITLTTIAGPVIGAAIGYCTNYIAVKMLFRPLKPIMLGKFKLPFTPGIIPRGRERLAKALGVAVGETLLTPEDMESMFLSEEVRFRVQNQVISFLYPQEDKVQTLRQLGNGYLGNEAVDKIIVTLEDVISKKMTEAIKKIDIGAIVASQGIAAVKDALSGSMMAMFVTDDLLSSFATPIAEKISNYFDEHGEEKIGEVVEDELEEIANKTPGDLLEEILVQEEQIRKLTDEIYMRLIKTQVTNLLGQANIPAVVEKKVNEMDILDIEELVLSVMKKELNAVVNLGALIGFILGLLNLCF